MQRSKVKRIGISYEWATCAAYAAIVDEIIIDIRARITFETSLSVEQSDFWSFLALFTEMHFKKRLVK